jgi:hypothetical protein
MGNEISSALIGLGGGVLGTGISTLSSFMLARYGVPVKLHSITQHTGAPVN